MMLYSSLQAFNQFLSAGVVRSININKKLITWDMFVCDHVCLETVKTVYHGLEIYTD